MIKWIRMIVVLAGLAGGPRPILAAAPDFRTMENEAARVVVLANASDPESLELARHYLARRGIPAANLVALPLPAAEEIDWHEYVTLVLDPLQRWLIERGWIDAVVMNLRDDAGRRKLSVSGHRIAYLVTCRGVPLKIRRTAEVPADALPGMPAIFHTHQAALDAELALIAQSGTRRDGPLPNPLFGKVRPNLLERDGVVRVSRLDAPTLAVARQLVDTALRVERQGLVGRALVDIGGPHARGDEWFGATVDVLAGAGWSPQVDRERATLPATARADGVALYFGWYAGALNGPFALPGFQFAPGAIALHLHSFSAASLRSVSGGGWCGPLLMRGVTGTFGNVYEPYMEFTHQPQLLAQALLGGATLGQAAYFAIPVVSWQSVVIGDPLYRPMQLPLAEQWQRRAALTPRWASYVALRRLSVAAAVGAETAEESGDAPDAEEPVDALTEAVAAMRDHPSLALALGLARVRDAAGDRESARRELGLAAYLEQVRAEEWGLLAEIAQQLADWEDAATAVRVWGVLLRQPGLPDAAKLAWLRAARPAADAAREFALGMEWDREVTRLAPPTVETSR